jgi:hypothetical protein
MENKIIRTICYFTKQPSRTTMAQLDEIAQAFVKNGYEIQTKRVCSPAFEKILELDQKFSSDTNIFGLGSVSRDIILNHLPELGQAKDTSFNLDLSKSEITIEDANVLFSIIKQIPSKTFAFTYVFNNQASSPFFPSGTYKQEGFAIGFQPTDLAKECTTLEQWLVKMKTMWQETCVISSKFDGFLGIDSSIAPLFEGKSSLINFIKKLGFDFVHSVTTDTYLKITRFIKQANPKPIGLGGIMFPCLEDFDLADEYEKGNFSIERNIFLSLHSGLGIDTYPIGIDEKAQRVLELMKLVQGLSHKYQKPLSVRFVSDGKAKVGNKTDFKNQFLKDVNVRPL